MSVKPSALLQYFNSHGGRFLPNELLQMGQNVPKGLGVNPRLIKRMMFVLFDTLVLGELLLWNGLLVYQMVVGLHMNDFGKFYYSALAFLHGGDMYGPNPATDIPQVDGHPMQFLNLNPPHFHIPLIPLAMLRPGIAGAIWGVVSLASLMLSWTLIKREVGLNLGGPWGWRLLLAGALMFAGTGATLVTGQLSFLLLLIVTIVWIQARRGKWVKAGALLGIAASVKPFLLIFLPYFALRRRYRAIVACLLLGAACFAVGILVFGTDVHTKWLQSLSASAAWNWAPMNASISGILSRVFAPSPPYSPVAVMPRSLKASWLLVSGLTFLLTMLATAKKTAPSSLDRDFALLLVSALLLSPLGWIYYLWLPLGPMTALVVEAGRSRPVGSASVRAGSVKWRNIFVFAGVPALLVPVAALIRFQPSSWATISLGSSYFWGTLALWCALIFDWRAQEAGKNIEC